MRVLVIPEDFRKDQYLLKPIIKAMLKHLGKEQADVQICMRPLLGGVSQALKWERLEQVINLYRAMFDLFILCVDRDGVESRRDTLTAIEQRAVGKLPERKLFIAEHAYQEIEVWALAGLDLQAGWSWPAIRAEINPKEEYFDVLAQQRRLLNEPGGGRKTLGIEAARRYTRIRQLCPEDIVRLEDRIAAWMKHAP